MFINASSKVSPLSLIRCFLTPRLGSADEGCRDVHGNIDPPEHLCWGKPNSTVFDFKVEQAASMWLVPTTVVLVSVLQTK